MTEFEISGQTYRAGRLDAFAQLHVARRLLPVVGGFGGVEQMKTGGAAGLMGQLGPGLDAFAKLPNDDVDFVINTCLGVVQRQVAGDRGWQKITAGGGLAMFEDIDLIVMLQLVWKVLEAHLEGLFFTLQRLSPAKKDEALAAP